jgi:hypothetical protein
VQEAKRLTIGADISAVLFFQEYNLVCDAEGRWRCGRKVEDDSLDTRGSRSEMAFMTEWVQVNSGTTFASPLGHCPGNLRLTLSLLYS